MDPWRGFQSWLWGLVGHACDLAGLWAIFWIPGNFSDWSHCKLLDLSIRLSSSMFDSCHLPSWFTLEFVWQASILDEQRPMTEGKLVLPHCLFRSFIDACHLSDHLSLCLTFVGFTSVELTSLIDPCHLSWTWLDCWAGIPPFTLLTSDIEPWCHLSAFTCLVGIPLETLTSDMDPCHLRVSLLDALPLEVVTTLSLPSLELSSQFGVGLWATASLSLRNLKIKRQLEPNYNNLLKDSAITWENNYLSRNGVLVVESTLET